MKQYIDLVKLVMNEGVRKPSRTGIETISYFGAFYKVDLSERVHFLMINQASPFILG
jgi:thymidylate synthase